MKIKGLLDEDFINYKKCSMTILFPYCTFKCGKENCQNYPLDKDSNLEVSIRELLDRYFLNDLTEAVVMQGLEPFDSFKDVLKFVEAFREHSNDDIVIYTGYEDNEIRDKVNELIQYGNIIIKYGRYIPGQKPHYDEILGVNLASDNQYALFYE